MDGKTKLPNDTRSNGLHAINRNDEKELTLSKEDINDNKTSGHHFIENNHPDIRLNINGEEEHDQLLVKTFKGSKENINFETGL